MNTRYRMYMVAKSLGVDELKIKTAQIYDFEKGSDLIPEEQIYSRYQRIRLVNSKLKIHWRMVVGNFGMRR